MTTSVTHDGKGAGDPADLGSAFGRALLAAVEEKGDGQADVAAAVTLGWYVAALAHPGTTTATAAAARGDLMTVTALTDRAVTAFCLDQVRVACGKLRALVERATLEMPAIAELERCVDAADDGPRREAADALDARALAVLSAADARLGKAYGVGRALLVLTTPPEGGGALAEFLTEQRVAPVLAAVDDLVSALPPHAGHSVARSIVEWRTSVAGHSTVVPDGPEGWWQLARQGEVWRALLSGEKSGLDMLEVDDYLAAADRLARRMRSMAWRALKRFGWLVALVVGLFALGVVLVLVSGKAAAVVAGAGTILASLGLTWRSAGQSLGALAGKLERPLWGAELDVAVTQAITLLAREDPDALDAAKQRRETARALGRLAGSG